MGEAHLLPPGSPRSEVEWVAHDMKGEMTGRGLLGEQRWKEDRKMEHRLEFLNPVLHYGLNVTIRDGEKWRKKASAGDKLLIYRTGSEELIKSSVIRTIQYKQFMAVTLEELAQEHDPECRTPSGLAWAMLKAYPTFTLDNLVTVIAFNVTD